MEDNLKNAGLLKILGNLMIKEVPAYANKILYSMGFLSMTCFLILIVSGMVMVFFGPDWWFTNPWGVFMRSVHLWAVQAFIFFILLHLLVVFLTSGYKPPRRLTWVLGAMMFFLVMMEAEFGYVLRNDFSSQWRSLQGADLYNGSGLGNVINNLNYAQIYGIHIIVIPLLIIGLLFLHYLLIKVRGIAKPYRSDISYRIVRANHTILFIRGFVLAGIIVGLAVIFPSPLIAPVTIKQIAVEDPSLTARTLAGELDRSSDTATYFDSIDPYRFDTRKVFIENPYREYLSLKGGVDNFNIFMAENQDIQDKNIKEAGDYFKNGGKISTAINMGNPVIPLLSSLVLMGQSSLYESSLRAESAGGFDPTYVMRFLSDTGVLEDQATKLGITTDQYGMLHEEKGVLPPGAWWLAPLGLLDHTVLAADPNQDRDGAIALGFLVLLLMAFPYIPLLNRIPDKLGIYKLIWRDKALQN